MIDSVFRHEFKSNGAVTFGKYVLWYKSLNLWNEETNEDVEKFASYEEAMEYKLDGKKIKDIVAEADISLFQVILNGGSGASGPTQKFGFGTGSGKSPAPDYDLPARMNTKIKVKTEEEAIKTFREMHKNSKVEHAVNIDLDGFASGYSHGDEGSVVPAPHKKGDMVVHNHPERSWGKNSHFSMADMTSTITTNTRGVIATHDDGYYKFLKGTHFKAEDFFKEVKKAKFSGKNYDDAVDRWLKRNQKRFGYSYEKHLDKKVKQSKPKTVKVPEIKFDNKGQGVLF